MTTERKIEMAVARTRIEMLKKPIFFNHRVLAKRWDVSRPTMLRWMEQGRIPPPKNKKGWSLKEVLLMEGWKFEFLPDLRAKTTEQPKRKKTTRPAKRQVKPKGH